MVRHQDTQWHIVKRRGRVWRGVWSSPKTGEDWFPIKTGRGGFYIVSAYKVVKGDRYLIHTSGIGYEPIRLRLHYFLPMDPITP